VIEGGELLPFIQGLTTSLCRPSSSSQSPQHPPELMEKAYDSMLCNNPIDYHCSNTCCESLKTNTLLITYWTIYLSSCSKNCGFKVIKTKYSVFSKRKEKI
jgi:hypothetical protein